MYRKTQSIFALIIWLKVSSGIKETNENSYINYYDKECRKFINYEDKPILQKRQSKLYFKHLFTGCNQFKAPC